jgi:hypothetical protein
MMERDNEALMSSDEYKMGNLDYEVAPVMDNEPAQQMSPEAWRAHLADTVVIEVHEPRLNLSQGSFLRCSRRSVSATIGALLASIPGNVRLSVRDSITAASLRRQS